MKILILTFILCFGAHASETLDCNIQELHNGKLYTQEFIANTHNSNKSIHFRNFIYKVSVFGNQIHYSIKSYNPGYDGIISGTSPMINQDTNFEISFIKGTLRKLQCSLSY